MLFGNPIGKISVESEGEVEWTINNIHTFTIADAAYASPNFTVSDYCWYLIIYPNGEAKKNGYVGWIGLYLRGYNVPSCLHGANFTFGVKRADQKVEKLKRDTTWVFETGSEGFGYPKLLQRSELLRRKSELLPSNALTITCSLRVHKIVDFSTRLDTLSRDLLEMFTSKKGCDATLKVKGEEFPVHKFVLAARSPVFAAMFEANMKEKQTGDVTIRGCDPEAFRKFLDYLYSAKVENLSSSPFELYRIADKYDVKELKSDCLIYIMANLNLENVFDAVILGDQFSLYSLKFKTKGFFNNNFKRIIPTAKWESFLVSKGLLANELLKYMVSEMK